MGEHVGTLLSKVAERSLSVSVEHNPHKTLYDTVASYLEFREIDLSAEVRDVVVERDAFWEVQCYPSTPVGFILAVHHDLEEALRQILTWLEEGWSS